MTTRMLCSIRRMVTSCSSITRRSNPISAWASAGLIPAVGSSSRRSFGRDASARPPPPPPPLPLTKPGAAGQDVPETEAETAVHADEDVLQDRHLRKETDVLEGPADAELCNPIRGQADEGTPVESDGAPIGLIHPGKHVEECRLPRSIGTNDGDDLPLWHRTVHLIDGNETAEALGHLVRLKEEHRHPPRVRRSRRGGIMPWGRKIIMRTRMMPKTIRSYLAGSNWGGSWLMLKEPMRGI